MTNVLSVLTVDDLSSNPAIVYRARAVVDAMIALTLADALALRFGTDWLSEGEDQ